MKQCKQPAYTLWHLCVISLLGMLIYSNSVTCAFQFDDKLTIVDNPTIKTFAALWPPVDNRWLGLVTFALNYQVGGLNPVGYHLVNIAIHIFTACAVYRFVALTLTTPLLNLDTRKHTVQWLAFSAALIFVSHPLQTQAVTYIVQRFASLGALFFILSLNCYVIGRFKGGFQLKWFGGSLLLAAAAVAIKENTAVLPVIILIYELFFFSGVTGARAFCRQHARWLVAGTATVLVGGVLIHNTYNLARLWDKVRATNEISRHDYLLTQFRVVVTYLQLFFVPRGQTVDHHFTVSHTLADPGVALSLTLLLTLLLCALYLARQTSYLRVVSFGVLWFFVTQLVESGVIPIIDVMFEHRVYLPSIGLILAVVASVVHLWQTNTCAHRAGTVPLVIVLMIVVTLFSAATYQRNKVWQSELTLWSDAIAKKPDNPRAYNMVGVYYQNHFRLQEAIKYFARALMVDGNYAEARSNYGSGLIQSGNLNEGLKQLLLTARNNRFDAIDSGILYFLIGKAYYQKGDLDQAYYNLTQAQLYAPKEMAIQMLRQEVVTRRERSAAHGNALK